MSFPLLFACIVLYQIHPINLMKKWERMFKEKKSALDVQVQSYITSVVGVPLLDSSVNPSINQSVSSDVHIIFF